MKAETSKRTPKKSPHDHRSESARVRKVIGQLEGIEKMILEQRHPLQLIQQVKAASSALMALRSEILKRHLNECLNEPLKPEGHTKIVAQILDAIQMRAMR